jgi:hypothetical protein
MEADFDPCTRMTGCLFKPSWAPWFTWLVHPNLSATPPLTQTRLLFAPKSFAQSLCSQMCRHAARLKNDNTVSCEKIRDALSNIGQSDDDVCGAGQVLESRHLNSSYYIDTLLNMTITIRHRRPGHETRNSRRSLTVRSKHSPKSNLPRLYLLER